MEVNPKYRLELGTATEVDTDLTFALGKTAKAGLSGPADPNYPAEPAARPLRGGLPGHLVCLE